MAAGFSLPKKHYLKFVDAFDAEVRRLLTSADLEAEILTDGVLNPDQLSIDTAQLLREAGPWGSTFPNRCSRATIISPNSALSVKNTSNLYWQPTRQKNSLSTPSRST